MHIIHALASGVVGAENGYARLFRRGTSTRATWYADFEASIADSSGADIPLDSAGGYPVYVNELVQVQVFSQLGQLIRDFVAGEQAYAVEVISRSFTGTDYTSGAQAASLPTTAGEVFDRWLASAGALDWKGLYSGESALLQNIFGALYGLFYNVKSPEFGAEGDGSSNDTAAFQAAHDAALAAGGSPHGGIVVVPPGVYVLTAELEWTTGVSLIGVPGTVTIRQSTVGQMVVRINDELTDGPRTPTVIAGISFDSTVSNTATQLQIGHGQSDRVHVLNCKFGASSNALGLGVAIGGSPDAVTLVRNCVFSVRADNYAIVDTSDAGTGRLEIENCEFSTPTLISYSSYLVQSNNNELFVRGSHFEFRSGSGDPTGIFLDQASVLLRVYDCTFSYTSGPVAYGINLIAAQLIQASGNQFVGSTNMVPYRKVAGVCCADTSRLQTTPFAEVTVSGTTATLADWTDSYFIKCTSTQPAITMPTIGFVGQEVDIVLLNQSGGAWAGPFSFPAAGSTNISYRLTLPNLANLDKFSIRFRAVHQPASATEEWYQVGEWVTW